MIKSYTRGEIKDLYGKKTGVKLEVNWNPDDENSNDCKVIKLTLPEGKDYYVKKEEFLSFLWLIGTSEEHTKMIPQNIVTKRRFEGLVKMKATKDIRKGENIVARCFHDLPLFEEEIVGRIQDKVNQGVIVPKYQ